MKVVFTFNEAAIASKGYRSQDIRDTVKRTFAEAELPCVSDNVELAFEDAGREDDYSDMWSIICNLMISGWFLECAASCIWEDEGEKEDILAQAHKFQVLA